MTNLPGRTIRSQPIASRALNPWCFIMYSPISVPVRPSPARQCTATGPDTPSAMARNFPTTSAGGGEHTPYHRSATAMPRSVKALSSYSGAVSRITTLTLR